MITSSNADFNQDGFAAVVRDLERAYLLLAESGIQGGDSPTSTTLSFTTGESNPSNTNLTIQPWEMKNADTNPAFFIKPIGGTILYDNIGNKFSKGSTVPIKYGDTFSIESMNSISGNWLDSSGVNPTKGNGGNARGVYAIDWQIYRTSNDQVASGNYCSILGYANKASSDRTTIVGGINIITEFGNNIYDYTVKNIIGTNNSIANTLTFTPSLLNSIGGEYNIVGNRNNVTLSNIDYDFLSSAFCLFGDNNTISMSNASKITLAGLNIYGSLNTISQLNLYTTIYGHSNYITSDSIAIYGKLWDARILSYNLYQRTLISDSSILYGIGIQGDMVSVANGESAIQISELGRVIFSYNNYTFYSSGGLVQSLMIDSFNSQIQSLLASGRPSLQFTNGRVFLLSDSTTSNITRLEVNSLGDTGINLTSADYPYFRINGTRLLTTQQSAIANVSYNATWTTVGPDLVNKFNDLLAKLRTHGIIAT